jgi:hypothetical protein
VASLGLEVVTSAKDKVSYPSRVKATIATSLPQVEVGSVQRAMAAQERPSGAEAEVYSLSQLEIFIPHPHRLRAKLPWWQKWASQEVKTLIQEGVRAPWEEGQGPSLAMCQPVRPRHQEKVALELIQEYLDIGAMQELVCPGQLSVTQFLNQLGVKHLVPWFVISKPEGSGQKHRLIADCRQVNQFLTAPHFKMDHWGQIFPFVRKDMWACKVDLKHAYFHLPLGRNLQEYLVLQIQNRLFQFLAAPFGLSPLPFLWTQVMKTLAKVWRSKGLNVFVYLDDILILAHTPKKLEKYMEFLLQTLQDSGMQVNFKKSLLQPSQLVQHLGFHLDLKAGCFQVPKEKLSLMQKELRQLQHKQFLTPRKMAAILGRLRSFLTAFPPLRSFADQMLGFILHHKRNGWDTSLPLPPQLQGEVVSVLNLMNVWKGKTLEGKVPVRHLHSDSSDTMWAGVDLVSGSRVQEHWRERGVLHITVKELAAAVDTVKSLAKPGDVVRLGVDNQVAYFYLQKGGGRLPHLNSLMRDFWDWCVKKNILVQVHLLKSAEDMADKYTRLGLDPGDHTLHQGLFLYLEGLYHPLLQTGTKNMSKKGKAPPPKSSKNSKKFKIVKPPPPLNVQVWDMFPSPGNHKFPVFCARFPHWEASLVDALTCPLEDVQVCYANPPWNLISRWLNRLRSNPHLLCWAVVPLWVSAPWWPLLVQLQVPGIPARKYRLKVSSLTYRSWGA